MMNTPTIDKKVQSVSLAEYAANLARSGIRIFPGGPETFWTSYLYGAVMRRPAFNVGPPAAGEVQEVLWRGRAVVASYLVEPDEHHPANACYVCTDPDYALDKLAPATRLNVRRGLKELTIAPLTS